MSIPLTNRETTRLPRGTHITDVHDTTYRRTGAGWIDENGDPYNPYTAPHYLTRIPDGYGSEIPRVHEMLLDLLDSAAPGTILTDKDGSTWRRAHPNEHPPELTWEYKPTGGTHYRPTAPLTYTPLTITAPAATTPADTPDPLAAFVATHGHSTTEHPTPEQPHIDQIRSLIPHTLPDGHNNLTYRERILHDAPPGTVILGGPYAWQKDNDGIWNRGIEYHKIRTTTAAQHRTTVILHIP